MTTPLLSVRGLCVHTPGGRPLLSELSLQLGRGDQVALVGRNGVGKSSLLRVLSGDMASTSGAVHRSGTQAVVRQQPSQSSCGLSPGETQRRRLEEALEAAADLLMLDEPTHDLDSDGIAWLAQRLRQWKGALLVVSHDRRLLRGFEDFFVIAESGSRHVHGSFETLRDDLERHADTQQSKYVRTLNNLVTRERSHNRTQQRRARKKNVGRLRELGRCTPRSVLNGKKSDAQESQGRRNRVQQARLSDARAWAKATRRALAVELPLQVVLPTLPPTNGPLAVLEAVSVSRGERTLFENIDLEIERDRVAIIGPNGAGKSTLLGVLLGEFPPTAGHAQCQRHRIAYVSQNTANWCLDRSTLEVLTDTASFEDVATMLRAHRFPFALADRPLRDLSPGERLRAALICVFAQARVPELLVLDEPTDHLDFVGLAALESVLQSWQGGLVVVSHDEDFLDTIGVERRVELAAGVRAQLTSSRPML
ncbi:MAG: ATP-binding cassette domain-containing protein [Nannocystaceae bacterium]|nr:ATP-binding cassette domain-containing protein [Nannocystaceae bacterium]